MSIMKSLRKVFLACAFGVGIALGASSFLPSVAEAYYADTTSAVSKGSDGTWRYAAINVVDDDRTVYTIYYRASGYETINYRFSGDTWRDWPENGKYAVPFTHMQELAWCGFEAVKPYLR